MNLLSKSKIISGLQCHKKLWLETHRSTVPLDSHLIALGNRFGEFARTHYGEGENLDGNKLSDNPIDLTNAALSNPTIGVIYEAAFIHENVLVRVDVLLRKANAWTIIEVKSSKEVKPHHLNDITVQAYVLQGCGITLDAIKIAHINKEFLYKGDGDYSGLLVEVDVTKDVMTNLANTKNWINDLYPIIQSDVPKPKDAPDKVKCATPYPCQFLSECKSELPKLAEVPLTVLPNIGNKLTQQWGEAQDLRDLPREVLTKDRHKIIQQVHQTNVPYINSEVVKKVRSLPEPYYFVDFETVMQGVPLIANTKPNDAIPFQWSVHCIDDITKSVGLDDGKYFLEFLSPTLFRDFLLSLIDALGDAGTIFVHHKSTEIKALRYLASHNECEYLKEKVEKIISRIEDTLDLVRDGMYFPEMGLSQGSTYSIKTITKVIPTTVDYQEDGELGSGNDAQLIWFKCTDSKIKQNHSELQLYKSQLTRYCAKDTLALVDLVRFIHTQSIL